MTEQSTKFMTSGVWRRKRKEILERDEHQCQLCKQRKEPSVARIVHHIYPLDEYPEYALEDWNLVSLCYSCHNMIDSTRTELTELGKQMLRDTAHKNGIPIPEKYK